MAVKSPEDMARAWADAFNSGSIEALLALYEPTATLIARPGQPVTGLEALRQALGGFLAAKPRIELRATNIVKGNDLALVYGAWTMKGTGPDGQPVERSGHSTEILRRQPDGTWRYAIDDPLSTRTV